MSKHNQKRSAFTIIEVVLVLAIAGLIFLMVFIALPALQRNRRDAQRKADVGRLKTAIDNYKANNRGRLPWSVDNIVRDFADDDFGRAYLKADQGEFRDPTGKEYNLWYRTRGEWDVDSGVAVHIGDRMFVTEGTKCADNGRRILGGGVNNYTIQMKLESGGGYCIEG